MKFRIVTIGITRIELLIRLFMTQPKVTHFVRVTNTVLGGAKICG